MSFMYDEVIWLPGLIEEGFQCTDDGRSMAGKYLGISASIKCDIWFDHH